ncbi:MAG: nucleoside deaminase [Calditrichaeota bacterium]|nr:MAG: nucleoside deaminase [Calditrichota bacterium]
MTTHETWMAQAFREAEKALKRQEVPIGAVIVVDGKIVGRGYNMVETLQDPTAHAEMIAITAAANSLGSWRLDEATLYVTKEPCPMCAGAIFLSRISHVVFGVSDSRMGACGSTLNVLQNSELHSQVKVTFGILESKCLGILQTFFRQLRQKEKDSER